MERKDATHQPHRELPHRSNSGVEIVLFWHQISIAGLADGSKRSYACSRLVPPRT
jgi:hypothetical protein